MKFNKLKIPNDILKGIDDLGFKTMTPIQEKAIPKLLASDNNFIGQAQTGTGKSAAFIIPLLAKLKNEDSLQSLILAPTRELALQLEEDINAIGKYAGFKTLSIYGGVDYDKQVSALKKGNVQIVIGTPGRVIDLIKRKSLKISQLDYLVLDEADEMLTMGFLEDVQFITSKIEKYKQLIMFSATMPHKISSFVNSYFGKYDHVKLKNKTLSNESITQKYYIVRDKHMKEALARLIDVQENIYAIVFCRTKLETKTVGDDLKARGLSVEVLNGDMGQAERDYSMKRFKDKKVSILVCTDVAARGIDVSNITHVFNFGAPRDNDSYVHRIGRTGRAGEVGFAFTIIGPKSAYLIAGIEKHINQKIELAKLPSIDQLKLKMVQRQIDYSQDIKRVVLEKGDKFRTEIGFMDFKKSFSDLSEEELLKVMFTWHFNKGMRRYNNLANIEEKASKPGSVGFAKRRKKNKKIGT